MRARASGGTSGDSSAARSAGDHVALAPPRDRGAAGEVDRAQLDRRPHQRAHHRTRVLWVGEQAKPGEQVAHLGALEEAGAAHQPVGDAALLQGGRHQLALVAHGAHQHRGLRRVDAVGDQPLELGRDSLGLRALVLAAPERDRVEAHCRAGCATERSLFGSRCSFGSTTACAASRIAWWER